jgi:hypothetical protein
MCVQCTYGKEVRKMMEYTWYPHTGGQKRWILGIWYSLCTNCVTVCPISKTTKSWWVFWCLSWYNPHSTCLIITTNLLCSFKLCDQAGQHFIEHMGPLILKSLLYLLLPNSWGNTAFKDIFPHKLWPISQRLSCWNVVNHTMGWHKQLIFLYRNIFAPLRAVLWFLLLAMFSLRNHNGNKDCTVLTVT